MAATGTPTPNLGLRIPQGTDPASVGDINYNSNLIDTKLGAVGNDSVQDQIDSLNSNLNGLLAFESVTTSNVSLTAGERKQIDINVAKTGYSPIAFSGIRMTGTFVFTINQFYIVNNTATVVLENTLNDVRTADMIVVMMYKKN